MDTTTATKHPITTPEGAGDWTYCTTCYRDVDFGRTRHYTTKAATIARRKDTAEAGQPAVSRWLKA